MGGTLRSFEKDRLTFGKNTFAQHIHCKTHYHWESFRDMVPKTLSIPKNMHKLQCYTLSIYRDCISTFFKCSFFPGFAPTYCWMALRLNHYKGPFILIVNHCCMHKNYRNLGTNWWFVKIGNPISQYGTELYMNSTHAKTISIVLNCTLSNMRLWVRGLCQSVSVSNKVFAYSSTPWIPSLIQLLFWQQTEMGSPILMCVLSPSSQCPLPPLYLHSGKKKTMDSTSSVSQVSVWTWSLDNLPRFSFLVHQMKASVCLS